MKTVIVQDVTTKHKVGCRYCPRHGDPVEHELHGESGVIYYSCTAHLSRQVMSLRLENDTLSEYMRVDVVFEGAVEMELNFTPEDAEDEYQYHIEDLIENMPDRDWTVSLYDESAEPPELVKEYRNEGGQ